MVKICEEDWESHGVSAYSPSTGNLASECGRTRDSSWSGTTPCPALSFQASPHPEPSGPGSPAPNPGISGLRPPSVKSSDGLRNERPGPRTREKTPQHALSRQPLLPLQPQWLCGGLVGRSGLRTDVSLKMSSLHACGSPRWAFNPGMLLPPL